MKKIAALLFCIMVIMILFPITARADAGPKPSVVINFTGLETERYYATLLSREPSTGPFSMLEDGDQTNARFQQDDADYDVFLKFAAYEDKDGFYFLQYFQDCSQSQKFIWSYYPPQAFKILLYFPETDRFAVTNDSLERYAFNSYFTAAPSNLPDSVAVIVAEKSYDYADYALSLLARVVLTIAIELGIALLFDFREKRQFRFIVLVNVVTQLALNVALNIINYRMGLLAFLIFYVLLEVLVFIIEALLYSFCLKRYSIKKIPGWKPAVYALAANFASFVLGLALAYWIPGIF